MWVASWECGVEKHHEQLVHEPMGKGDSMLVELGKELAQFSLFSFVDRRRFRCTKFLSEINSLSETAQLEIE